jgi:transposase InsO family protein
MDRTLWARSGEATLKAPHAVQWLSDNGPQYTATATVLYAHELGLVPTTTPAYSPESNGLADPAQAWHPLWRHRYLFNRYLFNRGRGQNIRYISR